MLLPCIKVLVNLFLSTPSARRATNSLRTLSHARKISIHALREEGDQFPLKFFQIR